MRPRPKVPRGVLARMAIDRWARRAVDDAVAGAVLQVSFVAGDRGFLHGPPGQWVEQLLPLVLEEGFSAFLLGRDDPRLLQTFGKEVGPALREAVAKERHETGTVTGPVRPGAAPNARWPVRRPGIWPAPPSPPWHCWRRLREARWTSCNALTWKCCAPK